MIKKLFAFILFPLLLLSNVQAQTNPNFTSEYDLVNQELLRNSSYNCSSTNTFCLETFTIKDTLYATSTRVCDTFFANYGCLPGTDQRYISQNRQMLADMRYQNDLYINQQENTVRANTGYLISYVIIGYQCEEAANTSLSCGHTTLRLQPDGSMKVTQEKGSFGIGFRKGPTNCPNTTDTYIPGVGCTNSNTNRAVSSIKNSCSTGTCPSPLLGNSNQSPSVDGIDIMTGAKTEEKTDINTPFEFSRNYISKRTNNDSMGKNWKHNYQKSLKEYTISEFNNTTQQTTSYIGTVVITQDNDEEIFFSRASATAPFTPNFPDQKSYSLILDSGSFAAKYTLTAPNGNVETYSDTGQLTTIKNKAGYTLTLSYIGTQLSQIIDSYGKTISFEYSNNLMTKATSSTGDVVDYSYNDGMLISQSFNNGRTIYYGYSGVKLTSKTNAKGELISTYGYDSVTNNANESISYGINGSVSGPINTQNIVYPASIGVSTTVTSNGTIEGFSKTQSFQKTVPSTINVKVGSTSYPQQNAVYTGKNDLSSFTDKDGNVFTYTYDSEKWLTTTTRNGITTTFTWDKPKNLLLSSVDNLRTTNHTYNNDGLLTQKTIISTNSGTRTWNYTWKTLGRMESQTEPNGAVTTYSYYSDSDADNIKGKLHKITNALGHEIVVNSYDIRGNPTSITMPGGLVQTYSYNDIGNILTSTVDNITTNYIYDADGLLTQVQMPTGYVINYVYDQSGRRISLSDNIGGSVKYTYDSNNLPINQSIYENSTLHLTANKTFDGLGRLTQAWKSNPAELYSYTYTAATNLKPSTEKNPRNATKTTTYNKSLIATDNGFGQNLTMAYDVDENPKTITANTVVYNLTYNEFSDILTSTNLNTGTDTFTYDIPNRIITKTDNAGIIHTTQTDLLDRPISIDSGGMQKTFIYDTNYIGKLTSAQNDNTSINYTYNNKGQVLTKTQVVNGVSKTIAYEYNAVGQVVKNTYPSGLEILYEYTMTGLLNKVSATGLGTIIQDITYQPITLMPLGWTWGNNFTRLRQFDTSGKITSLVDGLINQTYNSDGLFNILNINETGMNKVYEYTANASALNKMTSNSNITYTISNPKIERTASVDGYTGKTYGYTYTTATNKMSAWNVGSTTYNQVYDTKGNITNNGFGTFTYNNQNNMDSATVSGNTTSYVYNAFNERVAKINSTVNKNFMYDNNNQVIGEYESTDNIEYIYLGKTPIALYKNGQLFFIHTDYLETPRAITNNSQAVVWKWDNIDPFGKNIPTNLGIDFNLRFMGQYSDNETGLFYNYFRYYNPTTGRYIQPDPIGLNGGFDLYAYVGQNPINYTDPLGLDSYTCYGRPDFYPHGWIVVNNTPFGWNPKDDKRFTSTGSLNMETVNTHQPKYSGNTCTPIIVPKQSKFEECLINTLKEGIKNVDSVKNKLKVNAYNALNIGGENCFSVRDKIINFCKEASK